MSAETIVASAVGALIVGPLLWYALFDPIDPPARHPHRDDPPSAPPVLGQYVHVHRVEHDDLPPSRARARVHYDVVTGEVIEPADPLELGDGR